MKDIFCPNQRIIILQGLEQDSDYSLSNEMLQRLLKMYGHGLGIDEVDRLIDWLAEKGLVTKEEIGNGIRVAKLTRAGLDVAKGLVRIEGVDRPLPGV